MSRESVEALFPEADLRGSIPWSLIERECGPDAVVGRVAIRELFCRLYALNPRCGEIGDDRARELLQGFRTDEWRTLPVTRRSTLQAYATAQAEATAKGKRKRTGLTDV